MMWLVQLVKGILSTAAGILASYVSSIYAIYSPMPTASILSSVVGGVINLTAAKVLLPLNLWPLAAIVLPKKTFMSAINFSVARVILFLCFVPSGGISRYG